MTGVEAVSNGVTAFEEPAVKNAQRTLTLIVTILVILLAAIAYLCHAYQIGATIQNQSGYQSVLSQLTSAVVGRGWFYFLTMACVLLVLCLSANTAFVGFPRLCRLIAKDDFLPRAFATIGRRLVYSVGVLFLASASGVLLAAFAGITDRLIPLFAVGAFLAFTLSQAGMVMHWRRQRKQRSTSRLLKLAVNGVGAVATGTALAIILAAKFTEGGWITVLAIPLLITLFWLVHRHYASIEKQIECDEPLQLTENAPPIVVLPTHGWDRLTAKSLRFAMRLSSDVIAVHLSNLEGDEAKDEAAKLRQKWSRLVEEPARAAHIAAPTLDVINTPFREFVKPLLDHIESIERRSPDRVVAVIVPEILEKHWWHAPLHSRRASRLRAAIRDRQDERVIVIGMPWYIKD